MRWLLFGLLCIAFTAFASELEADLKEGVRLVAQLPDFTEGPLRTTFWELSWPPPQKLQGYSVTALSVSKVGESRTLEYVVHSAYRVGQTQVTVDSKTVMDLQFHLKSATSHSTTRKAPDAEVEDFDEEMILENGRVRGRLGKNGEWKEFDVGQEPCFWIVPELIQRVDLKDVTAFALRELNPLGRWVLPKVHNPKDQDEPPVLPRATEKTYSAETWQYRVTRSPDGSVHVEGTRPEYPLLMRKLDYDARGEFIACVAVALPDQGSSERPKVLQEMKAVSWERVEELKRLLQQPLPNNGRVENRPFPPSL